MKKEKLLITMPVALKRATINAARYRGCSQAEIVRAALYSHLKGFVEEQDTLQIRQGSR
jgi:hypothetical protein